MTELCHNDIITLIDAFVVLTRRDWWGCDMIFSPMVHKLNFSFMNGLLVLALPVQFLPFLSEERRQFLEQVPILWYT